MNQETNQLLQELAKKLGTTVEYLWGVLLKQASISATTQLIETFVLIVVVYLTFRLHRKFSKEREVRGYTTNDYEEYDLLIILPMLFFSIVLAILIVVYACSFDNIINGFFNPEYWALNKLLSKV